MRCPFGKQGALPSSLQGPAACSGHSVKIPVPRGRGNESHECIWKIPVKELRHTTRSGKRERIGLDRNQGFSESVCVRGTAVAEAANRLFPAKDARVLPWRQESLFQKRTCACRD